MVLLVSVSCCPLKGVNMFLGLVISSVSVSFHMSISSGLYINTQHGGCRAWLLGRELDVTRNLYTRTYSRVYDL